MSVDILCQRAEDEDWHVRYSVAKNKLISADAISSLSQAQSQLRETLTKIRSEKLYKDDSRLVRSAARITG